MIHFKVEVAVCGDLDVDPNRALPLTVRFIFPISAFSSDTFTTIVKCETFTCLGTIITINIYGIVINRSINLGWELIILGDLGIGARVLDGEASNIFPHDQNLPNNFACWKDIKSLIHHIATVSTFDSLLLCAQHL